MPDNQIVKRFRDAVRRRRARSTEERWEELVRRGAIDESGRVLVRGPQSTTAGHTVAGDETGHVTAKARTDKSKRSKGRTS